MEIFAGIFFTFSFISTIIILANAIDKDIIKFFDFIIPVALFFVSVSIYRIVDINPSSGASFQFFIESAVFILYMFFLIAIVLGNIYFYCGNYKKTIVHTQYQKMSYNIFKKCYLAFPKRFDITEDYILYEKENGECCYVRLHFLSYLRVMFLQEKIKNKQEMEMDRSGEVNAITEDVANSLKRYSEDNSEKSKEELIKIYSRIKRGY